MPFIHNVMNTDLVVGISDRSTDALDLLFNSEIGRRYSRSAARSIRRSSPGSTASASPASANILAAIKTAKHLDLGPHDAIVTVATDSAAMYGSERRKFAAAHYPDGFDEVNAGEVFGPPSRRRRPTIISSS